VVSDEEEEEEDDDDDVRRMIPVGGNDVGRRRVMMADVHSRSGRCFRWRQTNRKADEDEAVVGRKT